MMISTRGRYALRVLADLAEHADRAFVPMKEVAERQEISLKYLEHIIAVLSKTGYIEGVRGKGGGYRLKISPDKIVVGDILRLTEGDLAPVSCLEKNAKPCERADKCPTVPVWRGFYAMVNSYFDGITLADIIKNDEKANTGNA